MTVIIIGTLILHLPFASATGVPVPWLDSLFTATTSVCVTGLVTVTTASTWSFWGQLVILFLIQIGGLGVISFTVLFLKTMKKRIGMRERLLIRDAYNLNTYNGLVDMVRRIVKGTFLVEGIGAVLYSFVFVPEFGPWGIWKSIFNSVSAFCNAGMDVLGESSLIPYRGNLCVNL
ncbi:MAG: potassium transporter TrkG, partial [Acutalibacteraceae bacterium]